MVLTNRLLLTAWSLLWLQFHHSVQAEDSYFNPSQEKVQVMREAVATINSIIDRELQRQGQTYNSGLNDFLFARRVFIDLAGTIPTYEEIVEFANDKTPGKRTFLINKILASGEYSSHNYNYFANLLRIQSVTEEQGIRSIPFI